MKKWLAVPLVLLGFLAGAWYENRRQQILWEFHDAMDEAREIMREAGVKPYPRKERR